MANFQLSAMGEGEETTMTWTHFENGPGEENKTDNIRDV